MRKAIMLRTLILLVSLLLVLIVGCQQQPAQHEAPTPQPAPSPPPVPTTAAPPPSPASFAVISLNIEPTEVMTGDMVTVTAEIENTGGSNGTYTATLTLDGAEMATEDVATAPGTNETVTFSFFKDVTGIYRVKLAHLSSALIVKSPEGLPSGYIVEKDSYYTDDQIEILDITYMSDGLRIKGYMALPKAPGKYPAVIWNRGGNREFSLLKPEALKIYAQNGFVAIGSQYRGNGGGEGNEEFGGDDVNDVINLIPTLKSLSIVDADRIGMVGYSRGGMMTYLALKEQTLGGTNDIKVACTVGGAADLFMAADERVEMLRGVLVPLIGGSPSKVPQEYEARSATYWADKINVPLLIQHGEADENVSVEQSRKLAQELDKYGKVYKLITYPNGDHPLSTHKGGRPEILRWLRQYLK
ncbi:prolyl oligopeptidase family serine peptidase [Chloroflexota bacterium]